MELRHRYLNSPCDELSVAQYEIEVKVQDLEQKYGVNQHNENLRKDIEKAYQLATFEVCQFGSDLRDDSPVGPVEQDLKMNAEEVWSMPDFQEEIAPVIDVTHTIDALQTAFNESRLPDSLNWWNHKLLPAVTRFTEFCERYCYQLNEIPMDREPLRKRRRALFETLMLDMPDLR